MSRFFLLLCLTGFFCTSQNNAVLVRELDSTSGIRYEHVTKFIEVEVQDSLLMRPKDRDLIVIFTRFPVDSACYSGDCLLSNDYRKYKAGLEKKLRKYNVEFDFNYAKAPVGFELRYPDNYLIHVDPRQVASVTSQIAETGYVDVIPAAMRYENEDAAEEILFQKLLESAKRKAGMIANLANVKLGNIIEVSEVSSQIRNAEHYSYGFFRKRKARVKFQVKD